MKRNEVNLAENIRRSGRPLPVNASPADQGVKSINFGIDMIVLSSINGANIIGGVLTKNGFVEKEDVWVPHGNYERRAIYKKGTDELSVNYFRRKRVGYVLVLMYLPRPSKKLMHSLARIFAKNKVQYNFSRMKVSWDFEVSDADKFAKLLASRVFLKRSLTPCEERGSGVYYANDGRRSSKGLRIWSSNGDGQEEVKLRFTMSRSLLKSCGITFPPDPAAIDFKMFFEFNKLDTGALCSYLLGPKRETTKQRYFFTLARELTGEARDVFKKRPLMATIEYLRSSGVSRYSRFLKPMEREDALIQRAVREKLVQGKLVQGIFVDCEVGKKPGLRR
jgi:hypothetical protein